MAYIGCKSGGNKPIDFSVTTASGNIDKYGAFKLDSSHNYKNLKIVSYKNVGYQYNADYPKITIGDTVYKRPAVNTVIDIQGKNVEITSCTNNSSYVSTGVNIEIS